MLIDNQGYVKVADLGYAKYVKGARTYSTLGTVTYTPPELIHGRGRTTASDWWCCGVLLHEMLTGEPPFVGTTSRDVLQSVVDYAADSGANDALLTQLTATGMSGAAAQLITGLLRVDDTSRLGMSGFRPILEHPWFAGLDWVALLRRELAAPYLPPADYVLPDASDRVDPDVLLRRDFDSERWAAVFDQFGPMAKLHDDL